MLKKSLSKRGYSYGFMILLLPQAAPRRCSVKNAFLKLLRISQEITFVGVSFYEIFKNTYFEEHKRTTASVEKKWISKVNFGLDYNLCRSLEPSCVESLQRCIQNPVLRWSFLQKQLVA